MRSLDDIIGNLSPARRQKVEGRAKELMMFDEATLREEMAAMERMLKDHPKDRDLINRYVTHARKLRELESKRDGYVTARNGVTGY